MSVYTLCIVVKWNENKVSYHNLPHSTYLRGWSWNNFTQSTVLLFCWQQRSAFNAVVAVCGAYPGVSRLNCFPKFIMIRCCSGPNPRKMHLSLEREPPWCSEDISNLWLSWCCRFLFGTQYYPPLNSNQTTTALYHAEDCERPRCA